MPLKPLAEGGADGCEEGKKMLKNFLAAVILSASVERCFISHVGDFLFFFKKLWFLGIPCTPYRGVGATILIGREMICLPYAGFFSFEWKH